MYTYVQSWHVFHNLIHNITFWRMKHSNTFKKISQYAVTITILTPLNLLSRQWKLLASFPAISTAFFRFLFVSIFLPFSYIYYINRLRIYFFQFPVCVSMRVLQCQLCACFFQFCVLGLNIAVERCWVTAANSSSTAWVLGY